MTDDIEDPQSASDSQSSTTSISSSVCSAVNGSLNDHVASGGSVHIPSLAKVLEYLQPPDNESGIAPIVTDNKYQDYEFSGPRSTEKYSMADTSPADSGYQPPSNDPSIRSEHVHQPNRQQHWPKSSQQVTPAKPQRCKYPGEYGFSAFIPERKKPPKSCPFAYSAEMGKLYANVNVPCPVKFFCQPPPEGSIIRTMLVYWADENAKHPVERCLSHLLMDQSNRPNDDPVLANHVLQVIDPESCRYDRSYGRCYVEVPYATPGIGEEPFLCQYKFVCLTSCTGGMNRRDTCMVFTLQDSDGNLLGRDCIQLKISTSPGRDLEKELKKRKLAMEVVAAPPNKRKPVCSTCTTPGYRALMIKEENFHIVKKVNDALNLYALMSEECRRKYLEEELH